MRMAQEMENNLNHKWWQRMTTKVSKAALKEGEEEKSGDTDLKEEEKGIEMGDDFEGKMQDVEREEKEDDGDESGEDENNDEHDKQMGETEKGADKLDEKLWGEDDEENEDENEGE